MTQTLHAVPTGTAQQAAAVAARLVRNVEQVVHGRTAAVELVVCAVLAGGHVLVEDVPGSGKTTLARAVAASLGGTFRRIQATSDLLPGDITGSGVWEPETRSFTFVPGPRRADRPAGGVRAAAARCVVRSRPRGRRAARSRCGGLRREPRAAGAAP